MVTQAEVDYRETLIVAISQSGESTDTNLVLERARARGAATLGITNESRSTLARLAEHPCHIPERRERPPEARLLARRLERPCHIPERRGRPPEARLLARLTSHPRIRPRLTSRPRLRPRLRRHPRWSQGVRQRPPPRRRLR